MQEQREELVIEETVVEEFVVDGAVIAENEQRTEVIIEEHESHGTVTVVLTTGPRHRFRYEASELVGALVQAAVKYFGDKHLIDPSQPYELLLNGVALNNAKTLEVSGVKPSDQLTLSPCKRPIDG